MQWLFEVQQALTAAQTCLGHGGPGDHCPSHALHAITAAMATQGYWVQADLLYFLQQTHFQTWAILVYILAFFGALVSFGLGAPPKMWLWLVISPGIFHWLIADTVPMKGVHWNVGPGAGAELDEKGGYDRVSRSQQDDWKNAQREVWKLAEVGLRNTNIVKRGAVTVFSNREPTGGTAPGVGGDDDGAVQVSQIFSYYDRVLSDLVDFVISWTGLYTMATSNASSAGSSNLPVDSMYNATRKVGGGQIDDQNWLLSNLKWTLLEDITGAKLSSPDLRDAFATFMGSECGDAFSSGIDEPAFIAAHNSKGLTVPDSIFLRTLGDGPGTISEYGILTQELVSQSIPTPTSLRKFLEKGGEGSFRDSIKFLEDPAALVESGIFEEIRCDQYLYLLMHAFRWESGHIYYQLVSQLPGGFNPAALHYSMIYGWAVKKENASISDLLFGESGTTLGRVDLTDVQAMRFFQNLVLVHLWRNEMALVPRVQVRKSSAEETVDYVQKYQKTVGAKSKFGEVYSWAMLMPRVQGIVMYFLAMAYPFCAMLVLIPGWHKLLFTWATFWAWVKIWDIGFAIVFTIERSMWALIGNTPEATRLFTQVLRMDESIDRDNGSRILITCPDGPAADFFGIGVVATAPLPANVCALGTIPKVCTGGVDGGDCSSTAAGSVVSAILGFSLDAMGSFESWFRSLKAMDRSLTLGASMPLDLGNSYYIYIMSALYFAVPAVTGQLVLGAKAAAAGLATNAISGLAGEGGRAAGSGFSGDLSQRARANQTAIGQAAYAKDMRSQAAAGGFAAKALGEGNAKMMADAAGAFNQTMYSGEGTRSKFPAHNLSSDQAAMTHATAPTRTALMAGSQYSDLVARHSRRNPGELETKKGDGPVQAAPSTVGSAPSSSGTVGSPRPASGSGPKPPGGGAQHGDLGSAAAAGTAASFQILSQDLSGGVERAMAERTEGNIRQQAMSDALQGQSSVNAWGYGQRARGLEVSSGRNSQAGDFSAKSAQYDAERNFATALGGELAAMGAGNAVSVGSKPVGMEPMAMVGQLGKSMKSQAEFAGNGFQAFVASGQQKLQGMYGYDALISMYRPGNGQALMDRAMQHSSSGGALINPSRAAASVRGENIAQDGIQNRPGQSGSAAGVNLQHPYRSQLPTPG